MSVAWKRCSHWKFANVLCGTIRIAFLLTSCTFWSWFVLFCLVWSFFGTLALSFVSFIFVWATINGTGWTKYRRVHGVTHCRPRPLWSSAGELRTSVAWGMGPEAPDSRNWSSCYWSSRYLPSCYWSSCYWTSRYLLLVQLSLVQPLPVQPLLIQTLLVQLLPVTGLSVTGPAVTGPAVTGPAVMIQLITANRCPCLNSKYDERGI